MTSTLSNVSPVHGGLSEPVNRIDPSATSETGLPTVEVQDVDHTTLYRIADGTLSPLEGPMGEKDYNDVLDQIDDRQRHAAHGLSRPRTRHGLAAC